MKSDVETTIEGAMKLEALKWEMYKNFTNNFQLEGIKEYDPWNTPDWDHFYELATEFGQNADRYIEAMQNLHDKGVLTSNTPKTRMFTAVVGGYLKVKDALYEGQEKVLLAKEGLDLTYSLPFFINERLRHTEIYKYKKSQFELNHLFTTNIGNTSHYGLTFLTRLS
jgi:hypothetical protein